MWPFRGESDCLADLRGGERDRERRREVRLLSRSRCLPGGESRRASRRGRGAGDRDLLRRWSPCLLSRSFGLDRLLCRRGEYGRRDADADRRESRESSSAPLSRVLSLESREWFRGGLSSRLGRFLSNLEGGGVLLLGRFEADEESAPCRDGRGLGLRVRRVSPPPPPRSRLVSIRFLGRDEPWRSSLGVSWRGGDGVKRRDRSLLRSRNLSLDGSGERSIGCRLCGRSWGLSASVRSGSRVLRGGEDEMPR